jgi:hypothetical protein
MLKNTKFLKILGRVPKIEPEGISGSIGLLVVVVARELSLGITEMVLKSICVDSWSFVRGVFDVGNIDGSGREISNGELEDIGAPDSLRIESNSVLLLMISPKLTLDSLVVVGAVASEDSSKKSGCSLSNFVNCSTIASLLQ